MQLIGGILILIGLGCWASIVWWPVLLTIQTHRYNRNNPQRKTPRIWTITDYLSGVGGLTFMGTILFAMGAVLYHHG